MINDPTKRLSDNMRVSKLAIISMVLSILGFAVFFLLGYSSIDFRMNSADIFLYFILPDLLLALILGIIALIIILKMEVMIP